MKATNSAVNRMTDMTPFFFAAALYLLMTFVLTIIAGRLERYFSRYDAKGNRDVKRVDFEDDGYRQRFRRFQSGGPCELFHVQGRNSRHNRAVRLRQNTLLRCINGLNTITSGEMELKGTTGMVFQHFNLFPHMTCMENITYAPIKVKKEDKAVVNERARSLLKMVGLNPKPMFIRRRSQADRNRG